MGLARGRDDLRPIAGCFGPFGQERVHIGPDASAASRRMALIPRLLAHRSGRRSLLRPRCASMVRGRSTFAMGTEALRAQIRGRQLGFGPRKSQRSTDVPQITRGAGRIRTSGGNGNTVEGRTGGMMVFLACIGRAIEQAQTMLASFARQG